MSPACRACPRHKLIISALEAKRIPAVMEHPAFKTNPWATIRLHASNTLSTNSVPGKKEPTRRAGGMDVEP